MILLIALLTVASVWTIVALTVKRTQRVNAAVIFTATWTPILVICIIPGLVEPELQPRTVGMIALAYASVMIGFALGNATDTSHAHMSGQQSSLIHFDRKRIARSHNVLLVALLGYAALQVWRSLPIVQSLGGWSVVFSTAGGNYRRAQLESGIAAAQSSFDSGSAALGSLNYILFLGHAAIFTGGVLWCRGRRAWGAAPVSLCMLYGLLTLQRTSFVMAGLLFFFTVAMLRVSGLSSTTTRALPQSRTRTQSKRPLVIYVLAGAATALAIFYPLQLRNQGTGNATGLASVSQYLMSGILGLNARTVLDVNVSSTVSPFGPMKLGYGSFTFTNLFSVLERLGIEVPTAPNFFDFYRVRLGGAAYVTNTGTSALDFFLDFGWIGLFCGFFILSFLATAAYKRVRLHRVGAIPVAAFLLASIAWSFFGNSLLNDIRYVLVTVLGSWILARTRQQHCADTDGEDRVARIESCVLSQKASE